MTLVGTGREAAVATLTCMRDVAKVLPPRHLIDLFEATFAEGSPPHSEALWGECSKQTGDVMAIGVRVLAMIWDSAWQAGGAQHNPGRIKEEDLRALYEDPASMRSVTVNGIMQEIEHPAV